MLPEKSGFVYIHYQKTKSKGSISMLKIRNTIKHFISEKKAEGFLDVASAPVRA
jgi:hypothetical protein